MTLVPETREVLLKHAAMYETVDFLTTDPSYFMHQVKQPQNQETMALIASVLSYGSRKQFFPKIQYILNSSEGNVYDWIKSGKYIANIPDNNQCYYRLHTNHSIFVFLQVLQKLITDYGSLKHYITAEAHDGYTAIKAICKYFSMQSAHHIIPKDTSSACKRICMFLRWMVRDNSPVDLGLWADIIDKRTLIIPLDTHVLHEANKLALIQSSTASMSTARKLTTVLKEVFPDDPLKGDFALFGYGINH